MELADCRTLWTLGCGAPAVLDIPGCNQTVAEGSRTRLQDHGRENNDERPLPEDTT